MNENLTFTEPKTLLEDKRKRGWFWDHNAVFESNLSANAMLVRLYLARCANGDRQSWPSLNTIARHCKISKPTVIKVIKELQEKGWLSRIVRRRPNQEHETTVYILHDPPSINDEANEPKEGGGKADLPPVKNKTGNTGRVVKDIYHLVNQIDNVVKQVDSNNTQITIPSEQEKDKLFDSSLRSESNSSAPALRASCAAGGHSSLENKNPDSHPRAGVADATGKENGSEDRGSEKTGDVPSSKELIAELVKEYRAVEGVKEARGDYAFIGALYNRYGYDCALEAIQELALAVAVQEIEKPLLYLKAVVQAIAAREGKLAGKSNRKKASPGMSDWSACDDKKKKREMIRSFYMS